MSRRLSSHRISEVDSNRLRKSREDRVNAMTLNYQIGVFVGEYIISNYLPTLSLDSFMTRRCIDTTKEEEHLYNDLNNKWVDSKSKEDWETQKNYYKSLVEKYLPKELDCHIMALNLSDEVEFKKGISSALWDSDSSHYSCGIDDIIYQKDSHGDTIKLKLDI
jgi:hypothetical protein